MGLLWRLFAPKPLKKTRRTVRKAAHPVHTATRAVTPKPVKRLQRVAHPASLAELKFEDAAVNALRGKHRPGQSRQTAKTSKKAPATTERNERGQGERQEAQGGERPAWMHDRFKVSLLEGNEDLLVVGESYYQDNLWQLVSPRLRGESEQVRYDVYAVLDAEDDNPYDANAVAVWIQGLKVGHLSRANALRYRPGLLSLQHRYGQPVSLNGVIVGGGIREDGPGRLGVFLRHDPADFGL
jgi:hypothetical protein